MFEIAFVLFFAGANRLSNCPKQSSGAFLLFDLKFQLRIRIYKINFIAKPCCLPLLLEINRAAIFNVS